MRARPLRAALAALATTGVVAATILSSMPAAAAADTGFVASGILTSDENNGIVMAAHGSPGKAYPAVFFGAGQVTNVKLTFDFAGLAGVATPSFPDGNSNCTLSGTTATCAIPDITSDDGVDLLIPVKLTPDAGATDGASATFHMIASGTGAETDDETITVHIADGPDLVVTQATDEVKTKPGASVALNYTVTNDGSEDATDLGAIFFFTHGFQPDVLDNCQYEGDDLTGGTAAICALGTSLKPGDAVSVSFPGTVKQDAAANEFGASEALSGADLGAISENSVQSKAHVTKSFKARAHTGKKLTAKSAMAHGDTEIDELDNFAFLTLDVATSHDAVVGEYQLKGAVGDKVTAYLLMKNDGPASLSAFASESGEVSAILVTVPKFAEVTGAPDDCIGTNDPKDIDGRRAGKAGYPYYECIDDVDAFLPPGGILRYAFQFKITKDHGTDGSYAILADSSAGTGDSDLSNNTAKITLDATGDGSLPVTGSKAGLIGGIGGGLLVIGVLLVVAGRRRKRIAAI